MSTSSAPPVGPPHGRARFHYAWIVAAATTLVLVGAAGFRSAPGVLIPSLKDAFGWSAAQVSLASTVNLLLYGLMGPFAAALMARFGIRRVIGGALLWIALGAYLTTFMHALWQYVALWGVVVGSGSGCMASVLAATVANRWFVARKGIVTGVLTAASAAGQLLFLPTLQGLADHHGWPSVSRAIALGALVVAPIAFFVLRDRPEDRGLRAYGAPDGYRTPDPAPNPVRIAYDGLAQAWHSGAFWLLFGTFFVCGVSTSGLIMQHWQNAGRDYGITGQRTSQMLLVIGVCDVAGTIASGWLTDRIDPRKLLLVYYGLRGLSLLFVDPALARSTQHTHLGLYGFLVFYGLDWVATVPPTIALCREVFGPSQGSIVYGWVFAGHQLGGAAAAWLSGELRDRTGSYESAFLLAAAACAVAAVAALRIRTDQGPAALPPTPVAMAGG